MTATTSMCGPAPGEVEVGCVLLAIVSDHDVLIVSTFLPIGFSGAGRGGGAARRFLETGAGESKGGALARTRQAASRAARQRR